jgi:hypothetical protein
MSLYRDIMEALTPLIEALDQAWHSVLYWWLCFQLDPRDSPPNTGY